MVEKTANDIISTEITIIRRKNLFLKTISASKESDDFTPVRDYNQSLKIKNPERFIRKQTTRRHIVLTICMDEHSPPEIYVIARFFGNKTELIFSSLIPLPRME